MDKKQLVFAKLKLKAKALGFNVKELKGIAAKIADNLTSKEDASEEDVNAEIEKEIDAVLPYLTFGQSQANRLLEEWKKKNHKDDDDDDDDDDDGNDDSEPKNQNRNRSQSSKNQKDNNKDDAPAWAKGMMQNLEQLNGKIAALESEKTSNGRRAKLEALLKDTGTFGTRTLKSFSKMKFENEDEFEEFMSEVESDLQAYNQERADAGLSKLGTPPPAGGGKPKPKEEEPFTDEEIDKIFGGGN
ncbi:MAG: hypothetical protein IAA73_07335 [Bacteroidetes bacterium]|uniref:Uncharacterized protein n=1 Tax=Candidatus Gallipaludibacter merdavium TaxID=2840839 RepID=A0A9D9N4F4_9BACT|nr:hypothetical protein [Candidatus Gallipaludibacter merdavium]